MKKWIGALLVLVVIAGGAYWYMKEEAPTKPGVQVETPATVNKKETKEAPKKESAFSEKAKIELAMAVSAYQNGDYGLANKTLDKLLEEFPKNGRVLAEKGMTVALQGQTKEGLAYLEKAIKEAPEDISVLYNLAITHKLAGHLEESKAAFEKVLEKDPKNTWSMYGIATIFADQGKTEEALDALAKAIQLDKVVKEVAKVQDHFASFKGNKRFEDLVK